MKRIIRFYFWSRIALFLAQIHHLLASVIGVIGRAFDSARDRAFEAYNG